jgi:F0F1-type ATP synthase assembly protein I
MRSQARHSGVPVDPRGSVTRAVDQPARAAAESRSLHSGFGDALARAFEIAAIPVLFALFGRWLDSRFGTSPWLMLTCVLLAVVGLGARSYYGYKAQMEREEEGKPWKRSS